MQGLCRHCRYAVVEFIPHLVSFMSVYEATSEVKKCPQCNKKLILEYREKEEDINNS